MATYHADKTSSASLISWELLPATIHQHDLALKAETGDRDRRHSGPHFSYCLSSLLLTSSYLDATVNEHIWMNGMLPAMAVSRRLSEFRTANKRRLPKTEEKYAVICGYLPDQGSSRFQRMECVLILRTLFAHYTPQEIVTDWESGEPLNLQVAEQKLQEFAKNVPRNPFTNEDEAFFPHACLSAALCWRAIESAVEFTIGFHRHIGQIDAALHLCKHYGLLDGPLGPLINRVAVETVAGGQ